MSNALDCLCDGWARQPVTVARQFPEMFLEGYFAVTQGQWGMLLGRDENVLPFHKIHREQNPLWTSPNQSCHVETIRGFWVCFLKALVLNIVFLSTYSVVFFMTFIMMVQLDLLSLIDVLAIL